MSETPKTDAPVTWKQLGRILLCSFLGLTVLVWLGLTIFLRTWAERLGAFVAIPVVALILTINFWRIEQ